MKNTETKTRSEIISLLSEACELEHGLACSYLYSAFSLKQSMSESSLTWQQLQYTRKWAGQLYVIAAQEMMHLTQVWNLLSAVGGTPYYARPNFPQSHKYYPIGLPLKLEPFGRRALKRFIFYELPNHVSDKKFLEKEFHIKQTEFEKTFTVGKLYSEIREGINGIREGDLFIGDPSLQVGPDVCHFNGIVRVTGLKSANDAIDKIVEQGEGTSNDQVDCHYGLFISIEKDLDEIEKAAGKIKFAPARDIIENPITSFQKFKGPSHANPIRDPYTDSVAALFDNIYGLMLRMLQFTFVCGSTGFREQGKWGDTTIQIMTRVLKPLGEALTMLPAGKGYGKKTCGAPFGLYRHVSLPASMISAKTLVTERFAELNLAAKGLVKDQTPDQLRAAIETLKEITGQFTS